MKTKKIIYISAFIFLGALLSSVIHFAVEIIYIKLLVTDFDTWGLGLAWENWLNLFS